MYIESWQISLIYLFLCVKDSGNLQVMVRKNVLKISSVQSIGRV